MRRRNGSSNKLRLLWLRKLLRLLRMRMPERVLVPSLPVFARERSSVLKRGSMTEEELAAIEARANAATPGPWLPENVQNCSWFSGRDGEENADFVSSARCDVPDLIAEVRRLNAEVYEHDGVVECMRADEAEEECARLQAENTRLLGEGHKCTGCHDLFAYAVLRESYESARETIQRLKQSLIDQDVGQAMDCAKHEREARDDEREKFRAVPRYSTEAVDALLAAIESKMRSYETQNDEIDQLAEDVRSSREPIR